MRGLIGDTKIPLPSHELPSAEELEEELYYLVRPARVMRLARYRRKLLEAAAQEALDHPEAPAAAILKLREN